jgi:hypothetical protein
MLVAMWRWRSKTIPRELAADIRKQACERVAAGFEPEAEIAEGICMGMERNWKGRKDVLRAAAEGAVASAIREHLAEESFWPRVTDFDRLSAAFDALEASGIVARHNWTCCQNCGFAEIGDELDQARERGLDVRGFTFYHMQDTESAVEGHGLCLAYSSVESDEESVRVGHEIVEQLRHYGLRPEWSGELSKRITVPMDWKKRWVGET